jgi:hypothetical protein
VVVDNPALEGKASVVMSLNQPPHQSPSPAITLYVRSVALGSVVGRCTLDEHSSISPTVCLPPTRGFVYFCIVVWRPSTSATVCLPSIWGHVHLDPPL